jgi:hypothetical protein
MDMRGNRARFPLIGALTGRKFRALRGSTQPAGFAPLLTFPGSDCLKETPGHDLER